VIGSLTTLLVHPFFTGILLLMSKYICGMQFKTSPKEGKQKAKETDIDSWDAYPFVFRLFLVPA